MIDQSIKQTNDQEIDIQLSKFLINQFYLFINNEYKVKNNIVQNHKV